MTATTTTHPPATLLSADMLRRFDERAPRYDRENRFFTEDFEELRASGYLAGPLPADLGGHGLDLTAKGISVPSLNLPRLEHVGLASSVSLVADALKVELFATAGLFEDLDLAAAAVALPVMPVAAWVGRGVNRRVNESAFRWIFWSVVGGYTLRWRVRGSDVARQGAAVSMRTRLFRRVGRLPVRTPARSCDR